MSPRPANGVQVWSPGFSRSELRYLKTVEVLSAFPLSSSDRLKPRLHTCAKIFVGPYD